MTSKTFVSPNYTWITTASAASGCTSRAHWRTDGSRNLSLCRSPALNRPVLRRPRNPLLCPVENSRSQRNNATGIKATIQQAPQPHQAPPEDDPRGINGTTIFYAALVAAQLLPFSNKTNGLVGDLLYFSVTALSCIVIGVRRAPLEPPSLSAPISSKQVIAAPFTASIFLFGSYLLLKYTTVDVSLILNGLTSLGGALCVKESLDPVFFSLFQQLNIPNFEIIPASEPPSPSPSATSESSSKDESQTEESTELGRPAFTATNLASTIIAVGTVAAYLLKLPPSFVFSNAIAVALATRVLSLIRPSSFVVAAGLLVGLFFYDIFWVYGSEVMVSVATKIDTPGKLLFPREVSQMGTSGINYPYAILGLGDICVPGIFVSIAQSLDMKLAPDLPRSKQPYFGFSIFAYIIALFLCFFVNFQTNAAQPALLYLVPALIGSSLAVGAYRGELKDVISFSNDENDKKEKSGEVTGDSPK